jgi:hypothetical protein
VIWIFVANVKITILIIAGVLIQTASVFVASIGDATLGALIAGIFLLINTCLTLWLSMRFSKRTVYIETDDDDDDQEEAEKKPDVQHPH